MAKNKTTETAKSVTGFINKVDDEAKRDDAHELVKIFKNVTSFEPKMWGPSIIGFGSYHYKYESGHEGDAPLAAFSPRKAATVVYVMAFPKKDELLEKLGKYKGEKGCIYIKKLADVDIKVLEKLILGSLKVLKKKYS